MRDSVYRISLDIYNETPQVQITARKGDKDRRVYMYMHEYGKPWRHIIDGRTRAIMTVAPPSGDLIISDCDIRSDGTVIYDFTDLLVKDPGVIDCELVIYDVDEGVIASPKFKIIIAETVYDDAQIAGREWKDAIEEIKKELASVPITYDNAEDMANAPLTMGQIVSTQGRWEPNDGGARNYYVTDYRGAMLEDGSTLNPLAIPLADGEHFAMPVITDRVTVLDIGLERGRMRKSQRPEGMSDADLPEYVDDHERDDGWIPADNSAKLQAYIDAIPSISPDTQGDYPSGDPGTIYGGALMSRIFFPAGHWYFRDPVVITRGIAFTGTRTGSALKDGKSFPKNTSSTIVYLAEEWIVEAGSQTSSTGPFIGDGCRVKRNADPTKRGDENYDYTSTPYVPESAYFDHALFYVAASNTSFTGLDICAMSKEKAAFIHSYNPNNDDSKTLGPHDTAWRPDENKPWNIFAVHRRVKGVCAIITRVPIRNSDGKIMVTPKNERSTLAYGQVKYKTDAGAKTPYYLSIDKCSFSGFSGTTVIAGRLAVLRDSVFIGNYIAYQCATDDTLYNSWFGNGFCGLVTYGWQPLSTSGMYIDMMAGFGVMTYYSHSMFGKRKVRYVKPYDSATSIFPIGTKGDGGDDNPSSIYKDRDGEPMYFTEYEATSIGGRFYGHFDIVLDTCMMGAYYGYQTDWGAKISGIIERCGALYSDDILIVNKNDFGTLEEFQKVKDFYDNLAAVYATYNTESPYRWNGSHWASSTDTAKQSITDYLDAGLGWAENVPKAYKYISKLGTVSEPPETYVWDTFSADWVAPASSGETSQRLKTFKSIAGAYGNVILYAKYLQAYAGDGILLEPSDSTYYSSTLGPSSEDDNIDQLAQEKANESAIALANDRRPSGTAAVTSVEEAIERNLITNDDIVTFYEYWLDYITDPDHWGEFAPEGMTADWNRQLLVDRKKNFYKLIGTSSVNIMLAKGLVFSGQVQCNPTWRYTENDIPENMIPLFGFNLFYAVDCQISGFSRMPLSRVDSENHTGHIMTPVMIQLKSPSTYITACPHFSEDVEFTFCTNNSEEDPADKKYLTVQLSHRPDGRYDGRIFGDVAVTANNTYTVSGDPTSGSVAFSSYAFLNFKPYQNHYPGGKTKVRIFPVFGTGGGTQIGKLVLNFSRKTISIYADETFTGEIFPILLG